MIISHGQKTRWLKRPGTWREAWQVVVSPGTDNNSSERYGEKYTWWRDKYALRVNEVVDVGAAIITFDFKPVPKTHNLKIIFIGWYTGTHSAPKIQVYDYNLTQWVDVVGGALTTERTAEEKLLLKLGSNGNYWEAGTDNVRIRIFHPDVAGNTSHEFRIGQLSLDQRWGFSTTTTTTTTSTTTTS